MLNVRFAQAGVAVRWSVAKGITLAPEETRFAELVPGGSGLVDRLARAPGLYSLACQAIARGGKGSLKHAPMKLTVDASVWVSSQITGDLHNEEALQFVEACLALRIKIIVPELVLLEVAAAVARLTRDSGLESSISGIGCI